MPKNKNFAAVVLAAGLGTRMKSDLPKVLHYLGDMSLAERAIRKIAELEPAKIIVITGHKAEMVEAELKKKLAHLGDKLVFVRQKRLLGSGRAVQEAMGEIRRHAHVMVLCGDAPLMRASTTRKMRDLYFRNGPGCLVMTADLDEPGSYGRIRRDHAGNVAAIVEAADADEWERAIKEVNSGTYFFNAAALGKAVRNLKKKGSKGEYYLTDALENIIAAGGRVEAFKLADPTEMSGINSRADLAAAYAMLNRRKAADLMAAGVTVVDPSNTYIEEGVQIGADTVVYPGIFLKGATVIGKGCKIGPCGVIEDCVIDDGAVVKYSCALEKSRVRQGAIVGPFARLRPLSDIGPAAEIGNFAEVKKSRIGRGSKMHHHSYVGDTEMGEKVNIGAGTITCNYDGVNKNRTVIGAGAFIGSNTNLVAPVNIGPGAYTAAGSTITENVPGGTLGIARARQVVKRLKKRTK
ncbi:MAG: UDP-N-acetylglucosamine diphosphorylase/glucosamine-1-phosphate N-acetyltransferase [Elusimicrobia bacterium GWA2_62_23]|nr:MAG: UDP-N-acetylglucosamine diphosphorylase/glucosamine-1-phosphate N-acetyltransferase [Elusimicrobia bacterium GWA2_62_23]OGR69314.1 MAG: UDP-N-acetylglucosamine diphosphorylase/glucosamine-1-phosphate N-acetyltransferase [Elusimicrobia bacterium GWC2_63_65]